MVTFASEAPHLYGRLSAASRISPSLQTTRPMRLPDFILRLLMPWTWFGWKLASEPVPAPVQMKSSESSTASPQNIEPPAPVPSGTTLSPAPVQPLKTRPPATEQALLKLLHRDYAGFKVRAVDVEKISYPQLVKSAGWRAQPWDGKNGVGAHFSRLTRRTFGWFEVDSERKLQRAYAIPVAITVRKRA
jgi:hypothetical protein